MNKSIIILAITAFIVGTISTSYGQDPDKKSEQAREDLQKAKIDVKEAKMDLMEAKKDSIFDYKKFKKESEEKIVANEEKIAEFKVLMANDKKKNRAKNERELNKLEQKNIDLKKKLANYKVDAQFDWTSFKNEFNHDMDGLEKAFKDFTLTNKK